MRFSDFAEIVELCRNSVQEALQLEFKEKNEPNRPELDNGDKKVISKAVSAFANSGGGTLVLGIRTARNGEVDVATELRPIADPQRCRAQVEFVCKANISPEIEGLEISALVGPDGTGVIVCDVPGSEKRPHMSTAPGVHTYYRRTFQGDVPMTPFEVQEQMLAIRTAVLEVVPELLLETNFVEHQSHVSTDFGLRLSLRNNGEIPCKNPFMRATANVTLSSISDLADAVRGGYKTDFPYGTFIHVEDQLRCLYFRFSIVVDALKLRELFDARSQELSQAVLILAHMNREELQTVGDKKSAESIDLVVTCGAENSPMRKISLQFPRSEIAAIVLSNPALDRAVLPLIGVFHSDLVAAFEAAVRCTTKRA